MRLTSSGSWDVNSKTDPRWNAYGSTDSCGGFVMPHEVKEHIERMKELLKEEPPADLDWSYMKD